MGVEKKTGGGREGDRWGWRRRQETCKDRLKIARSKEVYQPEYFKIERNSWEV